MSVFTVRYFGLGPISFENNKKNAIILSCSLLINQVRIICGLFVEFQLIAEGTFSTIYGISQGLALLIHDFLVSMWVYTAITKLKDWTKISHDLSLDKIGCRHNQYVIMLCFFCYFIVILIEATFSATVVFMNVEMGYSWFNFHLTQCINYLLTSVLQCMITALAKKFNELEDDLHRQVNDKIINLCTHDLRIKCMAIGRRYKSLYDLNAEFNKIFGYVLLAAMCSFFSNILCGVQVFSTRFLEHVIVTHIFTFIMQLTISLVSFILYIILQHLIYWVWCYCVIW